MVTELFFDVKELKAKIKGVFKRLCCCYGSLLYQLTLTCSLMIGHLFDTMIVASTDTVWL